MKKYEKLFLIILMVGCASASFASTSITVRHIYNYSDQPWFVQYSGQGFDITGEKNSWGAWIIKPHKTHEMRYNNDHEPRGNLRICDSETEQRCYVGRLDLHGVYIHHDGNTGPAFDVNRPADGDIRIHKDYL